MLDVYSHRNRNKYLTKQQTLVQPREKQQIGLENRTENTAKSVLQGHQLAQSHLDACYKVSQA